jgi:hypothetical protein
VEYDDALIDERELWMLVATFLGGELRWSLARHWRATLDGVEVDDEPPPPPISLVDDSD